MFQLETCLPITQRLIRTRIQSRSEWEKNKQEAKRKCLCEKLDSSEEECSLSSCLDKAFLHELQQDEQTAKNAFSTLYIVYFEELRGCARQQGCKDENLTKDFVNQVFINFYVKAGIQTFELIKAGLKTYLCQAVKYKWLDYQKKFGKQAPLEDSPKGQGFIEYPPDYPAENKIELLQDLTREVFSNRASNCSDLMTYYFFKLWSYDEIMQSELGHGYATVKALRNRVSKCKEEFENKMHTDKRLRKQYGELYDIYRDNLIKK